MRAILLLKLIITTRFVVIHLWISTSLKLF
jgi:hypothetical protein